PSCRGYSWRASAIQLDHVYTGADFERVIDQPADLRSNTEMAVIVSSQKTTARAMNSIHSLLSENHPCTLFMAARGPFVATIELMRSQPDLVAALGTEVALQAVVGASGSVPIVFIAINYDPIARGYVTSVARPGGNITGVFFRQLELAGKQVELLAQAF